LRRLRLRGGCDSNSKDEGSKNEEDSRISHEEHLRNCRIHVRRITRARGNEVPAKHSISKAKVSVRNYTRKTAFVPRTAKVFRSGEIVNARERLWLRKLWARVLRFAARPDGAGCVAGWSGRLCESRGTRSRFRIRCCRGVHSRAGPSHNWQR
jgi:hypothetical protein